MSEYVLGSDAVHDLDDIWDYIAADSVAAADRWIAKLFDSFEEIARMPGMGHRREDLTAFPVLFRTVASALGESDPGVLSKSDPEGLSGVEGGRYFERSS